MSKSVKRIFKIVGIAALGVVTFGVGSLIVGGAALGSALGGGIAFGSLAVSFSTLSVIGAAALSIGTMPDVPSLEKTGANRRGAAFADPDAQGAFVFGTTTVPMALVWEQLHDSDTKISNVFAHAWHRIESYVSLAVDGEDITFSGNDAQGDWLNLLTWRRQTGTQTTALTISGTNWPATAVFKGVAHSSMTWNFTQESEKLRGGVPTRMDIVVQGAWLYDPRLDSTVGGSGSQRLDDPTTWSFNNGNAALVLLRFLIGEYSSTGELVWGRGAGYNDIDMDSFIAMANVADEDVDGKPRFRLGGMHLLDGSFENFVKRWEQETGGKLSKAGGVYKVWLPHNDLTPLTTITEDKLLAGPIGHTIAGELPYNTARGRYIEPTEGYRGIPYPEVSEPSAVADDGGKCVLYLDFSWVQDREIAERIARILVRRSRFTRVWTIPMGWEAQSPTYAPFTVHTLNIKETGNNPQLVRVIDRKMSMDGRTVLVLQQEDPSIYTEEELGDPFQSNTIANRVDRLGTVRGIQGDPGEDGVSVAVSANAPVAFRQAPNGGAWSHDQVDITFTFSRGGSVLATRVVRVTRSNATLTAALQSETGEATTHAVLGSGTSTLTVVATHTDSGASLAQAVVAVQGGDQGSEGPQGPEGPKGDKGDKGDPGDEGESYWTPVLVNVTRTGKTFTKIGTNNAWDASVYSSESFPSCHVSFRAAQTTAHLLVGLSQTPTTDNHWENVDFAIQLRPGGDVEILESGAVVADDVTTYTTADNLTITYDGYHVRYWKNNTLLRTTAAPGLSLSLDSSFYTVGAAVNMLVFQPGELGKIDLTTKVSGILSEAFIAAGALNENITINADGTLSGAGGGQVQIGQLPGSVAVGQLTTNLLVALQAVVGTLSAIRAELGHVVISTDGSVSSGATAYDGDGGWWLGRHGGEAALSMRSGTQFIRMKPSIGIETSFKASGSFTGTLTDNAGNTATVQCSYEKSFNLVTLVINTQGVGDRNISSSNNQLHLSGLPAAITPAIEQRVFAASAIRSTLVNAGASPLACAVKVTTSGVLEFYPLQALSTSSFVAESVIPTGAQTKGVKENIAISYRV